MRTIDWDEDAWALGVLDSADRPHLVSLDRYARTMVSPTPVFAPDGIPASVVPFTHAGATLVAEDFGTGPTTFLLIHGIGMGRRP